ncbi:MAG: PAS domain-containing protein [Alphaproteobacteria bacterium]|nr:PAS domain-containing protein [Alphaproteobacteria bacterium]
MSASAPGLIILAALAAWGLLAVVPALIAGAAILVATGLIVGRSVTALTRVRDAVDTLTADDTAAAWTPRHIPRRPAGPAGELWLAIVRLTRAWSDRIRTSEARLAAAEAVIAAVPNPLILLDERRRVVHVNAQAASLLGAVEGPRDLAAILRNPLVLAAADAVLRGEAARVVDFTLTVPVERQLQARFARIDRQSHDDAIAVLTLHDITQLKRAEQMRADFIANASHELRTPLTTLTGFIETLRGPAREDSEARERFLAIMHEQAARMIRLVEDLLSLSRIELNEHVMPQGRVALGPLLGHLADTLELRAGERGMRIQLDLTPDLPDVLGDRDELAQVFQNLVDNGIKYGRAGSEITVAAATGARPSYGGDAPESAFVSIAVRDRGEGIAREHLPRLTERFYRVDTARSREMGGTGLGLAIVKHILNRHRGYLEIESTPGIGSVFTVFLRPHPAATPAPCSGGMP